MHQNHWLIIGIFSAVNPCGDSLPVNEDMGVDNVLHDRLQKILGKIRREPCMNQMILFNIFMKICHGGRQ